MKEIAICNLNQVKLENNILKIISNLEQTEIDLNQCSQNLENKNNVLVQHKHKAVGIRVADCSPPYVWLYSDEKIKINIVPIISFFDKLFGQKRAKEYELFHSFYKLLMNNKWSTFDSS